MKDIEIEFNYAGCNPVIAMMAMQQDGYDFEVMDMGEKKKMRYYVEEGGFEPIRAHFDDAGMDLRTPEDVVIRPHDSAVIGTKTHCEIPTGFYGKLESKSGLHVKHDIVCLGGVIDASYRGEIVVKLYNMGSNLYKFKAGDKIVQMIIQPCILEDWQKIEDLGELEETERGSKGFGSSGK